MPKTADITIKLHDGRNAGKTLKELQQSANRLKREINDLEIGSKKWVEKTGDFKKVTGRLKEVRSEMGGVKQASSGILDIFSQFIPFGGTLGRLKTGVGGLTSSFKTLRGAIIATGIGALVVLLTSLVQWFTKTQRGIELAGKAMASLGAVLNVLLDRIYKVIDAFAAFIDGDFDEGFDLLTESVSGLGDEMAREAKLAWELKEAMYALEKQETDLTLTQAKRKKQIQELIFLTRDESKSFEERQKALEKANELELANLNDAIKLQKERIRIMQAEFDMAESTEEDRKALIQERVKLEDLETQSLARQRELLNRMNELNTKFEAERKKQADERRKRREAEEKRLAAELKKQYEDERSAAIAIQKMKIDMMDEGINKQIALIEFETQQKIDALKGSDEQITEQILMLQAQRDEKVKQLMEKNRLEQLDSEKEALALAFEEKELMTEQAFQMGLITEEERQITLYQLKKARLEKELELVRKMYGDESNEAKRAALAIIQIENQVLEHKKKLTEEEVQATIKAQQEKLSSVLNTSSGILGITSNVFGQIKNLYDEGSEEYKDLAIFQTELAAIEAGMQAFKTGSAIGGPILGGIYAAIAFAFGQVQLSRARAVKKAEYGMLLRGNRHSQGGIMVEAEDGEVILNRNVGLSPEGLAEASDLNVRYGGIPFFETGGPVNPVSGESQLTSGSMTSLLEDLNNKFDKLTDKLDEWPRMLEVHNNLQETQAGLTVLNDLQASADF